MPPSKRTSKKRRRPSPAPEELLEENQREEIAITFQHALEKGKCECITGYLIPLDLARKKLNYLSTVLVVATLPLSVGKKCLKTLGVDAKSDDIQNFLSRNGYEETSIDEWDRNLFIKFAASKMLQREKALKAFELIDVDGRGIILMEDLQRTAEELGENFSSEELRQMVDFADRSGEGFLYAKDFVRIARKVNL